MTAREIADRLLAARRTGRPFAAAPADGPADEAGALAAQALVAAGAGPAGAFKTGRKTADAAPLMAPILASVVHGTGAVIAGGRLRGVELEVGFRLERPAPDPDDPDFIAKLRGCLVALPAIEIVESRFEDMDAAGPLWKLADNQSNGALVLGEPVADWSALPLAAPVLRLEIAGEVVQEGPTPAPGGDPFATFAAFVRRLGGHCGGLAPGLTVITGSLTGMRFTVPGAAVEGRIDGLGTVSCRFA
ncbi:fumarylacetoacetate hydrolase family protein [Rubrimonas cliftonensis]|uniref:2-keto-4-pentenoate hydratase n=1 Tax=Rubrimonas cliftonensis TaxID=89524 RepID=A0A1H4AJH4_9RHOB|nr:fumarylacetoacetate hydrolase family protein [Rubrimonas cliftonensis]SEA35957.1 2-keto-4-pentenoate hydratase [Rubrimonas cliftonensis]